MKIKNFKESQSVKFHTILNAEIDTIYGDDFRIKRYVYKDRNIYTIDDIKKFNGEEYWQIKFKFKEEVLGWIKAENHIKMLNTVPQNVLVNKAENNMLNGFFKLNNDYKLDEFYTKMFMTIANNEIYFGLISDKFFIGFFSICELNFGEIEPLEITFKNDVSKIFHQPNLRYSYPFNNNKEKFLADSGFKIGEDIILGFSFSEKTYWVNIKDVNIHENEIKYNQSFDIDKMMEEYYINCVKADDKEYYNVNNKFNTTKKLKKIIMGFETQSSKSTLYKPINLKIGIICDEFMYYSLKDSAHIEYIPYSEDIEPTDSYNLVIVVSSWRGIDESWQYLANPNGKKREVLNGLLDKYNELGIPTVFYSKEDPVNYERFISIAKHCKYIYTSAREIIEDYKKDTNNDNVDYLEFSINPNYHNPIGKTFTDDSIQKQVTFAGSWMKKYPIRNSESAAIFDGVIESNYELNIVDRNFNRNLHDYQFPYKYTPYISKTINHEKLMKLHKATSWGINLNSVKYSNTMFANRVYELQAMGNIIISNYSMGVNNKFPYIPMVHNKEDVKRLIKATSQKEKLEMIAKGISGVMLKHTANHRINKILANLGYDNKITEPKILVVGKGQKSKKSFNQQLYSNKEFLLESDFNENTELKSYDFITYFNENYIYEEYYLQNLLSGFAYTDACAIEMSPALTYNFKKDNTFDKFRTLINIENLNEIKKVFNIPITELVTDPNENINEKEEKLLSVIIPIHNNGRYLEDKCFRSLKRSSIFDKMKIIMIDDGSIEEDTLRIITRLRRRHPDIVYYRFDEGSGSASRPRNKGIEISDTKYITFLDPDNEASGDGYRKLLDEMENDDELDLVLGNVLKEDNKKRSLLNYYYYVLINNDGESVVNNTKKFLIEANLRAHSIQALIVKSNILKDNNLKMIEGAAGQDTMFFQELLLNSSKFKAVSDIIHIYYAAVTGSVTTTIKKSFFEKYLILEKERVPFLKQHELYEIYVNQRFPYYFVNWYCKRLKAVPENEYQEVILILKEILKMYLEVYDGNDKTFNSKLKKIFNIEISKKSFLD